ncbi:MAG: hypothetical protein WB608_21470 [Terracidiphilus sp.]
MKLQELISNASELEHLKSGRGNAFIDFLKSLTGSKTPISVDGYMKKADKDDFFMFSESPRAATWAQISVRKVRALEYFGREFIPDGVCAKVRLTL